MGRAGRAPRDAAADDGIEFVAPRRDLFGGISMSGGDEPGAPTGAAFADDDDDRPARWTTALAGLGVASLIAVGVVAAAPWSEDAAPPPTSAPTTVPSTTAPTDSDTATTEPPVTASTSPWAPGEDPFVIAAAGGPPVGYLLDPATLGGGFVTEVSPPATGGVQSDRPFWIDVWATPGASSLTGDWVSVEVSPWPTSIMSGTATERVAVGDRVGLLVPASSVSTDPHLEVPLLDHTLVVTASGWSTDRLIALAASIDLADGRPVYPGDGIDGHELIVSRVSQGWDVQSELRSQAESTFSWVSDTGDWVQVTTRPADDESDLALRQLLAAPIDGEPYTGAGGRVYAGGRALTIGRPLGLDGIEATFDEGGRTVAVILQGNPDVDALLAYVDATRLRAGATSEWLDLQQDLLFAEDSTSGGDVLREHLVTSGTLPDGTAWTMTRFGTTLGVDTTYGITIVGADDDVPTWVSTTPNRVPSVSVGPAGAVAVVVVRADVDAVALRAGSPDGPMASTDLVPVDAGSDDGTDGEQLLVGILPFDVLGPWVAQVIDPDGAVIGWTASDGTSGMQ